MSKLCTDTLAWENEEKGIQPGLCEPDNAWANLLAVMELFIIVTIIACSHNMGSYGVLYLSFRVKHQDHPKGKILSH